MNNALVVLQQGAAALVDDAATQAIAGTLGGGLTGGGFGNRISLRGNRFRFVVGGAEIGAHKDNFLDVVLLAANPHVSRIFYAQAFDQNSREAPDCYSVDGRFADVDAPNRQNAEGGYKCMTCPQNVKGSSIKGDSKAKACAYKKRVVVVSPDAIDGDIYSLDVNAMSLFGEDQPAQNLYNLKSYIETLTAHQMMAVKLVTRLTFDDQSSVPKLHFTPIRLLTPGEWEISKTRMMDDSIQQMLADVINEAETSAAATAVPAQPAPAPRAPAPARTARAPAPAAPAPAAPAPAAPAAAAAAPQMPPLPRPRPRGRPANAAPAAAAAAAPPAPPATNGANGDANTAQAAEQVTQKVRGFTSQPEQPAQADAAQPKSKGFTIDLDEFDA